MELEENKISISTIKQYLQLIIHDLGKFTHLEFLTLKGMVTIFTFFSDYPLYTLYGYSNYYRSHIRKYSIGPTDRNLIDSLHIYFTSDIDIDFYQQL